MEVINKKPQEVVEYMMWDSKNKDNRQKVRKFVEYPNFLYYRLKEEDGIIKTELEILTPYDWVLLKDGDYIVKQTKGDIVTYLVFGYDTFVYELIKKVFKSV